MPRTKGSKNKNKLAVVAGAVPELQSSVLLENSTVTQPPSTPIVSNCHTLAVDPLYKVFVDDKLITESNLNTPLNDKIDREPLCHGKALKRKKDGLISNLTYHYGADGRVDWQKMFNPKHFFYINDDKTKEPFLKVDGLRDLGELRGIEQKRVDIQVFDRMVIAKVQVSFIKNIDDPKGRVWEATADATHENIAGKTFSKFLTAMAETRAMGRCIKEALGIRLCTYEEMSKEDLGEIDGGTKPVSDELVAAITRQCEHKGVKMDELVSKIQKDFPQVANVQQLTMEQANKVLVYLNEKQNAKD